MKEYVEKELPNNIQKEEVPEGFGAFLGIILGLGYLFVFPTLGAYVLMIFSGAPHTELGSILLSVFGQILACICTALGMYSGAKKAFKSAFKNITVKSLLKGIVFGLAVYGIALLTSLFEELVLHPESTNTNQSTLNVLLGSYPIVGIFFTCLFAPIIEELIFRFFIFGTIKKKNVALAYIVSALAFALVHFVATLGEYAATKDIGIIVNDLKSLPSYLVGGICLCFIYHKSGKISISIFSHIFYNFIVTISLLFSFTKEPLMVKDIDITDSSISITCKYNNESLIKIEKVEAFAEEWVEDSIEQTYHFEVDKTKNKDTFILSDLNSGQLYYIRITYTYEVNDGIETKTEVGTLETYATTYMEEIL